jgi:hypothetical protein
VITRTGNPGHGAMHSRFPYTPPSFRPAYIQPRRRRPPEDRVAAVLPLPQGHRLYVLLSHTPAGRLRELGLGWILRTDVQFDPPLQ